MLLKKDTSALILFNRALMPRSKFKDASGVGEEFGFKVINPLSTLPVPSCSPSTNNSNSDGALQPLPKFVK